MVVDVHHDAYSSSVLDKLKTESERRGLFFMPEAPSELSWSLSVLSVRPRNRTWFGIEGTTMMLIGLLFVPEPERKWSDRAWNRIEEPYRSRLEELEQTGWRDKRINFTMLQVWESEGRMVLLPLRDLRKVLLFITKGDFTVRKDGATFVHVTPRGEENISLNTSLSDLFRCFDVR